MDSLNLAQIKKNLKKIFQCDICTRIIEDPVVIACQLDKKTIYKCCLKHSSDPGQVKCPTCGLNHKIKSSQDNFSKKIEYAIRFFDSSYNPGILTENFANLIHESFIKFKYYDLLKNKPKKFLENFFEQVTGKIIIYLDDYKFFLDQELDSLNEKVEEGYYKAINRYGNTRLECSSLRAQIKSKILEFDSEYEQLKQKFLSLKFTDQDLIKLQFLIVRLHSFNLSLSDQLFPDEYMLKTPSEFFLKNNLGYFVKTPKISKDYDFENTTENLLFLIEIQNLKEMLKYNKVCLIFENEANEYLSLNVVAAFQKDSQNSECENFLIDTDLAYLDRTIQELRGKVKIIFWNKKDFDEKNNSKISWDYDIEFNFENTNVLFKTLNSNNLFLHDVYCPQRDSIMIGMKILIDHIQIPDPNLSPKLEEFVSYVKEKVNNDVENLESI